MADQKRKRISIPEYAMALAHVASLRSEDPFRKVGAVAIDFDNRVIGTAYNGLAPGFDVDADFWMDRDVRRQSLDALKDLNEIQEKELGHPETATRIAKELRASRIAE